MARFEDLPLELVNKIIIENGLPLKSLAALRLCWPHIDVITLPPLFRKVHITFAPKHLERLKAFASSPRVAPYVQELLFYDPKIIQTPYKDGFVHTDKGLEGYSHAFLCDLLKCIDALPNLHTFTSGPGTDDKNTKKEDIDGLLYAILPALCRPSSRITSLRLHDPLNYFLWAHTKFCRHERPHTIFKSLPDKYCTGMRVNASTFYHECACTSLGRPNSVHRFWPYEWITALRGLVKLDLLTETYRDDRPSRPEVDDLFVEFLKGAVNLEELSIQWKYNMSSLRKCLLTDSDAEQLQRLFDSNIKFPRLRTIKLAYVQLTLSGKPFQDFIERHAATLRHIVLCQINENVPEVIRFAARSPKLHLHRFVVFPNYDWRFPLKMESSALVPEQSLLEYINSNDPEHQDPLSALGRDPCWGTVVQRIKPRSVRVRWPGSSRKQWTKICWKLMIPGVSPPVAFLGPEEWPEQNGWMHVACNECSD